MTGQPDRLPTDGEVVITRDGDHFIARVVTDGKETFVRVSGYNGWRLAAALCLMLEIPMSPAIKKTRM
jgi:hypothetical protein